MNAGAQRAAPAAGTLYLVPSTLDLALPEPRPPLADVLPMRVLQRAATLNHWVVENAKSARSFLKRLHDVVPLAQPLQSLDMVELPRPVKGVRSGPPADLTPLLGPLLAGHDVGLLSEAGMPAVADPGAALVALAHTRGLVVRPLVGPSSLLLAIAAAGLNGQSFAFVGYLPVEAAKRSARLRDLEVLSRRTGQAQWMIETPYRNTALFGSLLDALTLTTRVAIACGLTTAQEWVRTDTVAGWRGRRVTIDNRLPAVFGLLAT
jgi:16S rRNA (cytidine1402-2'-O)-methyltransferase